MKQGIPSELDDSEKEFLRLIQNYEFVSFNVTENHIDVLSISDGDNELIIPGSICNLKKLKGLNLLNFIECRKLPDSMKKLESLRNLKIKSLTASKIPEGISLIPNLNNLNINLKKMDKISDEIWNLTTLEELILYNIKEPPEKLDLLVNLKRLYLYECNQLSSLPNAIGNLIELKEIHVQNALLMEIPESIGNCIALEMVNIQNCQLKTFPKSIGKCINLTEIRIINCISFIEFPDTIENLKKLKIFELNEVSIKTLPTSLGRCISLEEITLFSCLNLKEIPSSLTELPKLWNFSNYNCPKLSSNSKNIISQIEELTANRQSPSGIIKMN